MLFQCQIVLVLRPVRKPCLLVVYMAAVLVIMYLTMIFSNALQRLKSELWVCGRSNPVDDQLCDASHCVGSQPITRKMLNIVERVKRMVLFSTSGLDVKDWLKNCN